MIGERPVWAGPYARYDPATGTLVARDAPRTKHGSRVKFLWVMPPTREGPVEISGKNISSDASVRFDVEEIATRDAVARLDPDFAGVGESGWSEFPSYLYFDGAGCFTLEASWASGEWSLTFGFGR